MSPRTAPRSRTRARTLAIFILLLAGPSLFAFTPCEGRYDRALTLITGRCYLPQGNKPEAIKKLKAGWRSYLSGSGKTSELLGEAANPLRFDRASVLPVDAVDEAWREVRDLSECISYELRVRKRPPADVLPSDVEIVESHDGVLDKTFATLTLRLLDDSGKLRPATRLGSVVLSSQSDPLDVTPMFTLNEDGTIGLKDAAGFRRALNKRFDPFRLTVRAFIGEKQYESAADFAIGRFKMRVRLGRPTRTSSSLRSLAVSLRSDRTALMFESVTNADGIADFPLLPDDHYRIVCVPDVGGKRYFGRAEVELDRDAGVVNLPLATTVGDIERVAGEGYWRAGDQPPVEWVPIYSAYLGLNDKTALSVNFVSPLLYPGPLTSDSEAAAAEALEADRKRVQPMSRSVVFRVYDPRGRMVYRHVATMQLVQNMEGGAYEVPKPWVPIELQARPAGRIELDSADSRLRGSYDIGQLFADLLKPAKD